MAVSSVGEKKENVCVYKEQYPSAKNGTATEEVIKEQTKVFGQQVSATNSVHKN
jgi:hypothetical protein